MRSVHLVREHLSTTNNAAIKQKTGVMKPVLYVRCHLHHQVMHLQAPRHALSQIAVVKNKQKRNTEYIIFGSQVLIGIDIQFADPYFAFGFDPELVDNRCIGTAARSPRSPGEYEHRQGRL